MFTSVIIVKPHGPPGNGSKAYFLGLSPFLYTLFLDWDTAVTGELTPLFSLLQYYDLAAAPEPHWDSQAYKGFVQA